MTNPASYDANTAFDREVRRLRGSGALGEAGRLVELFDFLAARGPGASPATQAEIAESVFGQTETSLDDATVRVYIHRLRKRLEEHYGSRAQQPGQLHLTIPAGTYALRLQSQSGDDLPEAAGSQPPRKWLAPALAALLVAALAGAFLLGGWASPGGGQTVNAIWQPFVQSSRPKLIVVGDYYMFGEIDPVRPEEGRLIRDFRVDSPSDLLAMQELDPQRFGNAEDVGLNYLPFSVAYGLKGIVPVLARPGEEITVIAASELQAEMFNRYDVIYIGLFSGMALLEDVNFMESAFDLGPSYDELIDTVSGTTYTSEEARRLASPVYYRDYGYVARFRAPSGALVAIVAGARDTGLRGLVPLIVAAGLEADLKQVARVGDFEAVYQVTGQQGAGLSERLLLARSRD